MRARRLFVSATCLLLVGPLIGSSACAPAAEPPAGDAVAWVDGLEGGLAAARKRQVPALVYVRRVTPPSRACAELRQRVFTRQEAAALGERFVAIRLTAGDGAAADVLGALQRYGVKSVPALLVVNGRGHLLDPHVGTSLNEMLSALEEAQTAEVEFARLESATEPGSRVRLARALVARTDLAEAERALRDVIAHAPSAAAYVTLADLHAQRGDRAAERALLTKMLDLYPQADDRTAWRVRLATMELETPTRSKEEWNAKLAAALGALRALLDEVHAAQGPAAEEAVVRTDLGRRLSQHGDHEAALAELAWVLAHAADTPSAPLALLETGNVHWRQEDYAAAKECFVRILERYPLSPEAGRAPEGIRNCDQRLGN